MREADRLAVSQDSLQRRLERERQRTHRCAGNEGGGRERGVMGGGVSCSAACLLHVQTTS